MPPSPPVRRFSNMIMFAHLILHAVFLFSYATVVYATVAATVLFCWTFILLATIGVALGFDNVIVPTDVGCRRLLIDNPSERIRRSIAGAAFARRHHTWSHRVPVLLDFMNDVFRTMSIGGLLEHKHSLFETETSASIKDGFHRFPSQGMV